MKTKKTKKSSRFRPAFILALTAVTSVAVFQVACGDDDSAVKETLDSGNPVTPTDSSLTDTNQGDATLTDAGCFLNPTTHFQIINACTDATRIDKNPVLAKLLPDGGLPPLQ